MRIGVVCSAGGSSFFAAFDQLKRAGFLTAEEVAIATDRRCSAEDSADQAGISRRRFESLDNSEFSRKVASFFVDRGCQAVLLFYTRLVTDSLHGKLATYNIHPSLLPAFPGFGAIAAARSCGMTLLGATLHQVTEDADAGRIVAQVASPVPRDAKDETAYAISFVQKAYLTLVFAEHLGGVRSPRVTASASPGLCSPKLIAGFEQFLASRPETVLVP